MRKPMKTRITAIKRPFVVKGLMVLLFLCILIKAVSSMVSASLTEAFAARFLQDGELTGSILNFELGGIDEIPVTTLLSGVISGEFFTPEPEDFTQSAEAAIVLPEPREPGVTAEEDETHAPDTEPESNNGGLFYGDTSPGENAEETVPSGGGASTVLPSRPGSGILLDNTTPYDIDVEALLGKPLGIKLTPSEPAVLIIHTHTSEAYTQADGAKYKESDPFRTEDKANNIVRVGDELAAAFEERGISVIHDRRSYDYPSYTGSYNRTYASVEAYLKQYPSIKLVLDLHRDSITASDGSQYKTLAQIGDTTCSQVMFVVGSDAAGLTHPNWRENLKLALYLQDEMNVQYPSLARAVRISQYRYNQQLTPGSLILEVGCAGNTLEESLTAVKFFADAAANVFDELYE